MGHGEAYTQISPFAHNYERLRDLILRARGAQQLFDTVLPGFFIASAKRNKIDFPPELEAAVVAHGAQVADWKSYYDDLSTKYDEALRLLDERIKQNIDDQATHATLKIRIAELEAKLNAAPRPERGLFREGARISPETGHRHGHEGVQLQSGRSPQHRSFGDHFGPCGVGPVISDDTVRKWLKEAAELLPSTDPN
jgi:hypothetical protein